MPKRRREAPSYSDDEITAIEQSMRPGGRRVTGAMSAASIWHLQKTVQKDVDAWAADFGALLDRVAAAEQDDAEREVEGEA